MDASSINATTFKLFKKGSTTKLSAKVSYDASTNTATLDPTNSLRSGVSYKAVLTRGPRMWRANPSHSSTGGYSPYANPQSTGAVVAAIAENRILERSRPYRLPPYARDMCEVVLPLE